MKRIEAYTITNSEVLGSSVFFDLVYDEAPEGVVAKIYNPQKVLVETISADEDTNFSKRYSFSFDSTELKNIYCSGIWQARITATFDDSSTATENIFFQLIDDETIV